jgi:hypothetical protein
LFSGLLNLVLSLLLYNCTAYCETARRKSYLARLFASSLRARSDITVTMVAKCSIAHFSLVSAMLEERAYSNS